MNQELGSVFDPSPLVSDAAYEELVFFEQKAFVENEDQQKRRHEEDLHGLRKTHSWLLFGLTSLWILIVWLVVLFQGFGKWFFPLFEGYEYVAFKLTDSVMIAFITSTTASVLGLYGIAAYWLFGKPKAENKQSVKDDKKSE